MPSRLRQALASRATRIALALLALLVAAAVIGPWLSRFGAEDTDWAHIQVAPGTVHGHWLGSDAIGRDVFVRTLVGGRVSLLVALGAGGLALLLGLVYGAYAGTVGGLVERLLMRALDVVSALPFLLIVILLLTLFGRDPLLLIAAIGGYVALDLARMVRAESARLRALPFVDAARALGAGTPWLLRRHILPNVLGFAIVYLALAVPQAILVESFLSFLGLGVDEPAVSLGTLLSEGAQEIEDAPWVLIAPSMFMVLLLVALTVLGDALRKSMSPRDPVTPDGARRRSAGMPEAPVNTPALAPTALLALDHVDLHYAGAAAPALQDVSIALHAGRCLGVVGESGSGKSSLALALIGLLPADAQRHGQLHIDARAIDLDDRRAWRGLRGRVIGYVFQDAAASLHPLRSVRAQLLEMIGDAQGVAAALAEVGLPSDAGFLSRHPHQLSGGQRQRLMIALALAPRPRILVCDEPTSALDSLASAGVLRLLQSLKRERGLALVFVSHDLDAVAGIADDLLVLRAGRCEAQGAADVVMTSDQAYVRLLRDSRPRLAGNAARLGRATDSPAPRPPAGAAVIDIERLSARHAGRVAVDAVSLTVLRGETLGIIGASGSGKSTLVRALLKLHAATGGPLQIAGADPRALRGAALRHWRRRVQVVFQDPGSALDPRQSVRAAIGEALDLHGLARGSGEREARILRLLDDVRLDANLIDRHPHQLSGGQQQRVAIARALATDPEILVCDEAVSALDVSVQAGVLNLLADLRDLRGLSIVFVGHDLAAMSFIADRLIVLEAGRIVETGRTEDVLSAPQHPVTQALIAALPARLRT